jgi:hypothetical protein
MKDNVDDALVDRVARAIFKGQQEFWSYDAEHALPDRHFKVAITEYLSMARRAVDAVREWDAAQQGKRGEP